MNYHGFSITDFFCIFSWWHLYKKSNESILNTGDESHLTSQFSVFQMTFFLAEREIGASCCVDPRGVPGGVGVAHRYYGGCTTMRVVRAGCWWHTRGPLESWGSSGYPGQGPGKPRCGVKIVVTDGVVGASSWWHTWGPYGLRGRWGQGQQRTEWSLQREMTDRLFYWVMSKKVMS